MSSEVSASASTAIAFIKELQYTRKQISNQSLKTSDAIAYYTSMNTAFLDAIGVIAHESSDDLLARELAGYTNFLKSKERAGIERAVL